MSYLVSKIRKFLRDESGPTTVEYAILIALILLLCLASIQILGSNTQLSFDDTATKIDNATGS